MSERTGGVPLFVEEVTRLLLERGEQGGAQAIPPTLQQSLAARLDRLGPAREVAMIGAVLGRGFSYLLAARCRGARRCDAAIGARKARRGRHPAGRGPAAGGRIPLQARADPGRGLREPAEKPPSGAAPTRRPRRCAISSRIARPRSPKLLAHHFTQAGLTDAAIEYWGKAGDQALRRSAFQEAIAHLGKAIEMADKAAAAASRRAEDPAPPSQRLKLQSDYGRAMLFAKGFAAEETKAAFARAAELAGRTDDFSERFLVLLGQYAAATTRGELRSARELALALLREAEDAGRATEAGIANSFLGLIAYWRGNFAEARTLCERALAVRDPNPDPKI